MIPLSYQPIDIRGLNRVMEKYEGEHYQQMITDFEDQLASLTGAACSVALNSGTSSLHLALKLCDVGPGDFVLAPTFTYIGAVSPIQYVGASPVFVECDEHNWNFDMHHLSCTLQQLRNNGITPKAAIVVHNYGMPADMEGVLALAKAYGFKVIEDAAEALGSTYHGGPVGNLGHVGVLSFNNNKTITAYGGGALLVNKEEEKALVLKWASHARENLPYYFFNEAGFNYRMSPLNAMAGLASLEGIADRTEERRHIFHTYYTALVNDGIAFQQEPMYGMANRWLTCCLFPSAEKRENVRNNLTEAGFETRPLWNPMHRQPVFSGHHYEGTRRSEYLFNVGLCLPCGPQIPGRNQEIILDIIKKSI